MDFISGLFANVNGVELLMFIGAIIFFAARLEENNKANKELLTSEIKHVINIMEISNKSLREDIGRLERKQEESNKIKERLTMQEVFTSDIKAMLQSHISDSDIHR